MIFFFPPSLPPFLLSFLCSFVPSFLPSFLPSSLPSFFPVFSLYCSVFFLVSSFHKYLQSVHHGPCLPSLVLHFDKEGRCQTINCNTNHLIITMISAKSTRCKVTYTFTALTSEPTIETHR